MQPSEIKSARERLKETQSEFAQRFGVNQSTIQRWETSGISERSPLARRLVEIELQKLAPKKRRQG